MKRIQRYILLFICIVIGSTIFFIQENDKNIVSYRESDVKRAKIEESINIYKKNTIKKGQISSNIENNHGKTNAQIEDISFVMTTKNKNKTYIKANKIQANSTYNANNDIYRANAELVRVYGTIFLKNNHLYRLDTYAKSGTIDFSKQIFRSQDNVVSKLYLKRDIIEYNDKKNQQEANKATNVDYISFNGWNCIIDYRNEEFSMNNIVAESDEYKIAVDKIFYNGTTHSIAFSGNIVAELFE